MYKIGNSGFTNVFLKVAYPLTTIKFNQRTNKKISKQPFQICITVDTEPGYVKKDYTRKWITKEKDNPIGYTAGIKHLLDLADKYDIKLTFLLCTKAFSYEEKDEIIPLLKKAFKKGHEIGLHHHPERNPLINGKYPSSKFYKTEEIQKNLRKEKEIIKKCLGEEISKNVVSFRWGNWALFENAYPALEKEGFKIDSSAVPGINGHLKDNKIYDWKKEKRRFPWLLKDTKVLEIPIATFSMFGKTFRADPFLNSQLLINGFKKYHSNQTIKSKPFKFVVITHTNEMTKEDGSPSYVLKNLESFIIYAQKYFVQFNTLSDEKRKI